MADNQLIKCKQNEDMIIEIPIFDDDDTELDISDMSAAAFKVTDSEGSGTVRITKSFGSGCAQSTTEDHVLKVTVSYTDLSFAAGNYYWAASITKPSGKIAISSGRFVVVASAV